MFKTISTPEKVILVKSFFPKRTYISNEYWLAFNPIEKEYGWVANNSTNANRFIELKELNQDVLNQLALLHSIGFTPKEIAYIINGDSDVYTGT